MYKWIEMIVISSLLTTSFPMADAISSATQKVTPPTSTTTSTAPPVSTTTSVKTKIPDKNFTIEQVAKFNGKNGAKSYVIVSGIVYDVSKVAEFKTGSYKNMKVGTDITKAFNALKNAKTLLKKFIPVGKLVKSTVTKNTAPSSKNQPSGTKTQPSVAADSKTNPSTSNASSNTPTTTLALTLDQLETYNGKNGQPAYVAVDGIIYDVSALKEWRYGNHYENIEAGKDLSEAILESPHGKAILDRAIPVGTLKKD